jgi:hypothetical protein
MPSDADDRPGHIFARGAALWQRTGLEDLQAATQVVALAFAESLSADGAGYRAEAG